MNFIIDLDVYFHLIYFYFKIIHKLNLILQFYFNNYLFTINYLIINFLVNFRYFLSYFLKFLFNCAIFYFHFHYFLLNHLNLKFISLNFQFVVFDHLVKPPFNLCLNSFFHILLSSNLIFKINHLNFILSLIFSLLFLNYYVCRIFHFLIIVIYIILFIK